MRKSFPTYEEYITVLDNLGTILATARTDSGKTQEYMATHLCVSRKLVQLWESGDSQPTFRQTLLWFYFLHLQPMQYFWKFLLPMEDHNVTARSDDEEIRQALHDIVDALPPRYRRQMLYLWYGKIGQSSFINSEVITALLHLPISHSVIIWSLIKNVYTMLYKRNDIRCPENILPDLDLIQKGIDIASDAYSNGADEYSAMLFDK